LNGGSCPSEERPPTWRTSRRSSVPTVGPASWRPRRQPRRLRRRRYGKRRPPARPRRGRRFNRIPILSAIGSSK